MLAEDILRDMIKDDTLRANVKKLPRLTQGIGSVIKYEWNDIKKNIYLNDMKMKIIWNNYDKIRFKWNLCQSREDPKWQTSFWRFSEFLGVWPISLISLSDMRITKRFLSPSTLDNFLRRTSSRGLFLTGQDRYFVIFFFETHMLLYLNIKNI